MPRVRSHRPTIWTDARFVALSRGTRLTLLGIIDRHLDDHGRGSRNVREVLANVYPTDDSVTQADVEREIAELLDSGILSAYVASGQSIIELPEWSDKASAWYQKVDHPSQSLLPSREPRETLASTSRESPGQIGEDRRGQDRKGEDRTEREEHAPFRSVLPLSSEIGKTPPSPIGARQVSRTPGAYAPSDEEIDHGRAVSDAEYGQRRRIAAAWSREHPDELAKIESAVDLELAHVRAASTLKDELRKSRIMAEVLRRVNSQPLAAAV